MQTNSKWKSNLLSSSLPLEFEAAKILVSNKFFVNADYTYSRDDAGTIKDFSVDIEASGFPPFKNSNKTNAEVNLLIECKHRTPETKWFFLPIPDPKGFLDLHIGQTLRAVDHFCPFKLNHKALAPFYNQLEYCYKGLEIKIEKGEVFDTEIKHGVSQLQYALPGLLSSLIRSELGISIIDTIPFFFCPILLTNAELFVANPKMLIKDVEKAKQLEDVAHLVPYLVLHKELSPDFMAHCKKEFQNITNSLSERLKEFEKEFQVDNHLKPLDIVKGLEDGDTIYLDGYFTKYLVCNLRHFKNFIDLIKKTTHEASATKTEKE